MKYLLLFLSVGLINASNDNDIDLNQLMLNTPEKCINAINKKDWFLKAVFPEKYVAETYDNRLVYALKKAQEKQPNKPITGSGYQIYSTVNQLGIQDFEEKYPGTFIYSVPWLSVINNNAFARDAWQKVSKVVKNNAPLNKRLVAWTTYTGVVLAILGVMEKKNFPNVKIRLGIPNFLIDNQDVYFTKEETNAWCGGVTVMADIYQQQYATDPEVFKETRKKYLPQSRSEKK